MALQVFGGTQQAGGFPKAMKEHREHNQKQGAELLQLADGLDHNELRLPYVHQAFPTMLYKPDPGEKGEKVVKDATEKAIALQNGWREEPYPRVQIAVLDPATEKANLMDTNNRLQAQLVVQNESIQKMQAQMAELLAGQTEKRGPGRPPNKVD